MEWQNEKLEEFKNYIKNRKTAIIGLGVSNLPLLNYLSNLGAKITVFDNRTIDEIDKNILDQMEEKNIEFSFGKNNLSKLVGYEIIYVHQHVDQIQ